MIRLILTLLLTVASVSPALCDDTGQPPPADKAADMQSMKDFLQANPDCREFTDSCSYCRVTDGSAICSTPQIACVKKPYQCTARSGK
ncbi:hypothetical protein RHSP_82822 [Rhizobium freirei PRF 81]|uniref:Transmembrane protein n=1 Tax=Rhizobium freirei PRF 81 TaxID=363754 RepID=N6U6K5_9HYPH|nr:hypothetical protein [Rhizobium freirei]ENN85898.1 hypothetical protein RHSP_82822 [Rhizobium freirei PRF 81]